MRDKVLRIILVLAALAVPLWVMAEDVTGPTPIGANVTRNPVQMGAYAQPSALPSPVAAGKVDRLTTDGEGNLWTRLRSSAVSVSNLWTGNYDTAGGTNTVAGVGLLVPASGGAVAVGGTANGIYVQGSVAHDGVASGNPVLIAGRGYTAGVSNPSGVSTDGDVVYAWMDQYGRQQILARGTTSFDAPIAGGDYPVLTGGYAHATGSLPTPMSANGDMTRTLVDRYGRARIAIEGSDGVTQANVTTGGQLRTITDANADAVGISNYCAPSHAGGGTEVTVKASAGLVKYLHVSNPNTTDVYLHLWDASNPTPGTTDPLVCYTVPGGTGASNRGVYDLVLPEPGITCATAITATVTTAANGSSAPGSAVTLNIGYK